MKQTPPQNTGGIVLLFGRTIEVFFKKLVYGGNAKLTFIKSTHGIPPSRFRKAMLTKQPNNP